MTRPIQVPEYNRHAPIPVETMRTLLVCRGPIAFETLEVYRRCHWELPHVVVSAREWIAERQRTAPWLANLPSEHVHYIRSCILPSMRDTRLRRKSPAAVHRLPSCQPLNPSGIGATAEHDTGGLLSGSRPDPLALLPWPASAAASA
jgi:hypothetical protein